MRSRIHFAFRNTKENTMKKISKKTIAILFAIVGLLVAGVVVLGSIYDTHYLLPRGKEAPPISVIDLTHAPLDQVVSTNLEQATDLPSSGTPTGPIKTLPQKSGNRLLIPSIKVDAAIENVGLTSSGDMETPLRLANVGWYKYGTKPGDMGSAVISGHVDNSFALPAVFYHLKEIKKDDAVYVTDANGKQLHFIVTDTRSYSLAEAPGDAIFNDASERYLKLITCEGTWTNGKYAYDHRIVVTAVLAV